MRCTLKEQQKLLMSLRGCCIQPQRLFFFFAKADPLYEARKNDKDINGNSCGFQCYHSANHLGNVGEQAVKLYLAYKGVHSPSKCMSSRNNSTEVPTGGECECEVKFNNSLCPLNYAYRIKHRIWDYKNK